MIEEGRTWRRVPTSGDQETLVLRGSVQNLEYCTAALGIIGALSKVLVGIVEGGTKTDLVFSIPGNMWGPRSKQGNYKQGKVP